MIVHPTIREELGRQHELELRRRLTYPGRPRRQEQERPGAASAELAAVVEAARCGDRDAWGLLVERFTPLLRTVAREYRLQTSDVDDVVQATWASALIYIEQLREPAAIGGWLATTARRNAISMLRSHQRETFLEDPSSVASPEHPSLDDVPLRADQRAAVRAAVDRLPDRQRSVVASLLETSRSSYVELAAKLKMPVGSIGPTRERALARLRRDPRLRAAIES